MAAAEKLSEFETRLNVTYATHDSVALAGDLYLPKGAGPFPVLVGVHGGGWVAGLIYDHFSYYAPAFWAGVALNAANLVIITFLVLWGGFDKRRKRQAAEPDVMPGAPA